LWYRHKNEPNNWIKWTQGQLKEYPHLEENPPCCSSETIIIWIPEQNRLESNLPEHWQGEADQFMKFVNLSFCIHAFIAQWNSEDTENAIQTHKNDKMLLHTSINVLMKCHSDLSICYALIACNIAVHKTVMLVVW